MELTGNCYISAGRINKRCLNVFEEYKLPKKSNVYGYGTVEEITQWYLQKRREGLLDDIAEYFSIVDNTLMFNRQDFIDKMIQLQDHGLLEQLCEEAADKGNMDILNNVFHNSNVTVLDYLRRANGSLCYRAARFGYLDILKWYRSHGCEWNASVFNAAGALGQDHILEYLRFWKVALKMKTHLMIQKVMRMTVIIKDVILLHCYDCVLSFVKEGKR